MITICRKAFFYGQFKLGNSSFFEVPYSLLTYLISGKGFGSYEHEASFLRQLIRKPIPYKVICKIAQLYSFRHIQRPNVLQTSDPFLLKTIEYTLRQIRSNKVYGSARRMQNYYHLAEVFQSKSLSECNVLIVGPKFIVELILAWTYGFKWSKIHAIDIIQNNPKILLADVDNFVCEHQYDVIVMANVFGYNNNPTGCLDSLSNCLADKGLLVFNSAFLPNLKHNLDTPLSSSLDEPALRCMFSTRDLAILSSNTLHHESSISTTWVLRKEAPLVAG